MKTRVLIARILLLVAMVSPFGQRAFGFRMGQSSCHVRKLQAQTNPLKGHARSSSQHRIQVAAPGHRPPTQRFHRGRGNRINVENALVPTPSLSTIDRVPFSNVAVFHQALDGPNPSRGPPSQLYL